MRKIISLVLKAVIVFFAASGTVMSILASAESFMGGTNVLKYFTIQSNIAIAVICLIGAVFILTKKTIPGAWYVIKFIGTVSITLTGAVFCFVLAPTMGKYAWGYVNVATHVIVPVASIVDFFVTGIDSSIKKKSIPLILLPPLAYVIYAAVGYVLDWQFAPGVNYPYFFLNWGSKAGAFGFSSELPFMGCMWWILFLLACLIGVGFLYIGILNALKKRAHK